MSEKHPVSFDLEINVEPAYTDVRKFQTVLSRTLSMVSRASGSEDLKNPNPSLVIFD